MSLYVFICLLFYGLLTACGPAKKAATPSSSMDSTFAYEETESPNPSPTLESVKTNSIEDFNSSATQSTLNEALGATDANNLNTAVNNLNNSSSAVEASKNINQALLILQKLSVRESPETQQKFAQLLQQTSKEIEEMRKQATRNKVFSIIRRVVGRIIGFIIQILPLLSNSR